MDDEARRDPGEVRPFAVSSAEEIEAFHRRRQAEFPTGLYGAIRFLTPAKVDAFEAALAAGPEEGVQAAIADCPYLLQYATPHTGHHGLWAFPKPMIRPKSLQLDPGLIPDFLIVTASSLGYTWHIVELKRFDADFANPAGDGFSTTGHRAVTQCLGYLDHFQNYIDAVRVSLRIKSLVQPKGAILLIGDSKRETSAQKGVRSRFVTATPRIDVVSYDRLVTGARTDLMFQSSAAAWQEIG